jgi:hypothetical protein
MAELPDKATRTVLCGGRPVMDVPTAIPNHAHLADDPLRAAVDRTAAAKRPRLEGSEREGSWRSRSGEIERSRDGRNRESGSHADNLGYCKAPDWRVHAGRGEGQVVSGRRCRQMQRGAPNSGWSQRERLTRQIAKTLGKISSGIPGREQNRTWLSANNKLFAAGRPASGIAC